VAALRSGINVRRHTMMIYMIAAGCAGVAGMIYTARFSAGAAQAGEPLLLDSIAAVVIGGASLVGGRGHILGTIAGVVTMAVLHNVMTLLDINPDWQGTVVGVVILGAVLANKRRA
jgi:ribose transport system permease protein